MAKNPYQMGGVVNLVEGESVKDVSILTLPARKGFEIKFVGINGFGQPNQPLFFALRVSTQSRTGNYPIALTGNSEIADPEFPKRFFGSQQVELYADPGSELIFTVARRDTYAKVRVFVDMYGFLVDH
jgi:hypothetical protein